MSLVALLESVIQRVESGEIDNITIAYKTRDGKCRVICSEGDIEIPDSMQDQMEATAEKILGKQN